MKKIQLSFAIFLTVLLTFAGCRKHVWDKDKDDDKADGAHVRWDIVSVDFPMTTTSPGGVAYASAITGSTPSDMKIKIKGAGTFVAATGGGSSSAVTGGGDWETFLGDKSTGSGTYKVTKLASWEFANFWVGGPVNDKIGAIKERANGTAVLTIEYSDGTRGTLGIACHGPGAPDGIVEGIVATKGYVTYWTTEVPTATEDKNRTLFHVSLPDSNTK